MYIYKSALVCVKLGGVAPWSFPNSYYTLTKHLVSVYQGRRQSWRVPKKSSRWRLFFLWCGAICKNRTSRSSSDTKTRWFGGKGFLATIQFRWRLNEGFGYFYSYVLGEMESYWILRLFFVYLVGSTAKIGFFWHWSCTIVFLLTFKNMVLAWMNFAFNSRGPQSWLLGYRILVLPFLYPEIHWDTVDGRYPNQPRKGCMKPLWRMGKNYLSLNWWVYRISEPSTVEVETDHLDPFGTAAMVQPLRGSKF